MAIEHGPPPRGSYNFVMQRSPGLTPLSLQHGQVVPTYDERLTSRACRVRPGDQERHTLFLKSQSGVHRLLKFGWIDVTAEWERNLAQLYPEATTPPEPPPAPPKRLTERFVFRVPPPKRAAK